MDPYRADGRCDVIADCMWTGSNGGTSYDAVALRVTNPCTPQDVVQALCRQVGCKEEQVEQLWLHETRWEQDVPCPVEMGMFVVFKSGPLTVACPLLMGLFL